MLVYSIIEPEAYERIKSTRKTARNKRSEILAQSNHIYLLFPNTIEYSYTDSIIGGFRITVNGKVLEEVIRESELPYYDELVDEFEYYKPIYIVDKQYIELQENSMYGRNYVSTGKESILFYNKGIWVKEVFFVGCLLPAAFKMQAVINYKVHGIKLDVSRNRVLEGRKQINWAVSEIMLKYILSKGVDVNQKPVIKSMLETVQNEMLSGCL